MPVVNAHEAQLDAVRAVGAAMVAREPVAIVYRDGAGVVTTRTIIPEAIEGDRCIRGHCVKRGESRCFRVDRIERLGENPGSAKGGAMIRWKRAAIVLAVFILALWLAGTDDDRPNLETNGEGR